MTVRFSDPFLAISWDGMHAHDHGLGGKHLWPALQDYIKLYGRAGPVKVDAQYAAFILVRIPYYHSLLIFLFSIELQVFQLGEGFIILIK
jgi:hypothetical protein